MAKILQPDEDLTFDLRFPVSNLRPCFLIWENKDAYGIAKQLI